MPAGGLVVVEVSPFQASAIVWWLESVERSQNTTPIGVLAEALWQLRDQHDVSSLTAKFRKVAGRKRAGSPFRKIVVQLTRADAAWLAQKVSRRGMFGRRLSHYIPVDVETLGYLCAQAIGKKRGRRKLEREKLATTLSRQHLDERHRKRLRARQREEAAMMETMANYQGILAKALMGAGKST